MAAIAGSAAVEFFERGGGKGASTEIDIIRKFQRALSLAMRDEIFTDDVAERYLSRISLIPDHNRQKYLQAVLQRSEKDFDEQLTSVAICDHAMQSDVQWKALQGIYALTGEKSDKWADARATFEQARARASGVGQSIDERHRRLEERHARRGETIWGRLVNWYRSIR